ncbi:MAG: hypothetical protein AAFX09_11640 [Pseudomonadota bacterium]
MKSLKSILAGLTVLAALTACATPPPPKPVCRAPDAGEMAVFRAIVGHDEDALARWLSPDDPVLRARLRQLEDEPRLEEQIFGRRMGDPSVRTVLMQPPVCVYDTAALPRTDGAPARRLSYVMPRARFNQLQDPERLGLESGIAGRDHAVCSFVETESGWRLADACLTTFQITIVGRPAPGS